MMSNLIPLEYSFDYPRISVLCEDIFKNKIAFTVDATYLTPEEANDRLDRKIAEYDMKSAEEIRNMTMAEYAHYRQIYFADNNVSDYSSHNGILYDKQPGYISPSRKSFTKSIEPRTSGNPFDYPKPIISAAKSTVIESPKNYYYYYWAFINAQNQDDANAALDSMINLVTLDLQPRADGKSWADDPKPVTEVQEKKDPPIVGFIIKQLIVFVAAAALFYFIGLTH